MFGALWIRSWWRDHICAVVIRAPGRGDFFRPIWRQVLLQIDQLAKSNLRSGQSQVRKAAPCVRTADDAPAVVASSRLWPILVAREREPVACCAHRVEVESSALGCQWWWWWCWAFGCELRMVWWQLFGQMEGASVKMHFQLILSLTIVSAKADFFDDCVLLMQFLRSAWWSNIWNYLCFAFQWAALSHEPGQNLCFNFYFRKNSFVNDLLLL